MARGERAGIVAAAQGHHCEAAVGRQVAKRDSDAGAPGKLHEPAALDRPRQADEDRQPNVGVPHAVDPAHDRLGVEAHLGDDALSQWRLALQSLEKLGIRGVRMTLGMPGDADARRLPGKVGQGLEQGTRFIEPDARSAALAALVAQAVSAGSLPERAWHAAKATQGTAPARGPGFPEVTECRTRLLPAGLIDPSRVASWIEAQAAREGGPAGAYLKVPLTEAEQETLGQNGGHARASYAALLGALAGRLAGEAEGELPATILEWPELLTYENPGGKPRLLRIRGDRELAFLKTVARSLTGHFDCWSEPEAVAFVLSGWVPPLAKLRARTRRGLYRAASRITYDVDPRTSPAALAEFHRRLRRRWVEGRDRLLGDKALALAVFADAAWQPGASWEELKERWNREHPPGDALHSELPTNQFATECRGAWERLTNEIWPQGSRAARHLRAELDAVRAKRRREAGTGLEGPPT